MIFRQITNRYLKATLLGLVSIQVFLTWAVLTFHYTVLPEPQKPLLGPPSQYGVWISREDPHTDLKPWGIHQVILRGSAMERGWAFGAQASDLMYKEEVALKNQLDQMIPNVFLQWIFQVLAIRWFWGIENYIEREHLDEMYGVSLSASKDFEYILPNHSRQLAYHGLHEVGQMMVDQNRGDFGCTVLAVPHEQGWLVGRNFDFEAGPLFDEEKIMKWVFPDQGFAFVSVIWAGMVGAVTGVNERGVYISINAAGSEDFSRYGTPSTLVVLKALQWSRNAIEARDIITQAKLFITDIIVVADAEGNLFRIEKSPEKFDVQKPTTAIVITNHLISPIWEADEINRFRATELTSHHRQRSGERVVTEIEAASAKNSKEKIQSLLNGLRDKNDETGAPLNLSNRRAIDALIATHSVIYDSTSQALYVSQGPALAGPFRGFDLKQSFQNLRNNQSPKGNHNKISPVTIESLPEDPHVSVETLTQIRHESKILNQAAKLLKCGEDLGPVEALTSQLKQDSYLKDTLLGHLSVCKGDKETADQLWRRALELKPAYWREEKALRDALKEL